MHRSKAGLSCCAIPVFSLFAAGSEDLEKGTINQMEKKNNALKLENQVCFPLYAAAREVVKLYRPFLEEIDLTYTQYICMMVFWDCKCCSVKELGEKLWLDSGTLTPVLKSLEAKGYVRRSRSMEDERVVNVSITEKGDALKAAAADIPVRVSGNVHMSAEELGELYRLLYKLLDSISED